MTFDLFHKLIIEISVHNKEGKSLGTLKCCFFGFAHHHVITCAPIQTYTKYHMITELVEPRITANIFLHVCGGVWERDYQGFI